MKEKMKAVYDEILKKHKREKVGEEIEVDVEGVISMVRTVFRAKFGKE